MESLFETLAQNFYEYGQKPTPRPAPRATPVKLLTRVEFLKKHNVSELQMQCLEATGQVQMILIAGEKYYNDLNF